MIKKLFVSLLCMFVITGFILGGFLFLYFSIPSRSAMASISLPSSVEDKAPAESETTEKEPSDNENIYVADVYQSLTLREQPSVDAPEISGLPPLTEMEVLEFISGTDYAYVNVMTGGSEGAQGYVNYQYITRLGEPTVRAGAEE